MTPETSLSNRPPDSQTKVFNDTWMRAFHAAEDGANSSQILLFSKVLLQVAEDRPCLEPWAAEVVKPAIAVSRAIVSLCCHVPCLYKATLKDVEYLMPESKASTIGTDLPKVGRILLNRCKADQAWLKRKELYISKAGIEMSKGPMVQEMMQQVMELAKLQASGAGDKDRMLSIEVPLLSAFAAEHTGLVQALRPEATVPLQQELLKYLSAEHSSMEKTGEVDAERQTSWVRVLKAMSITSARPLFQSVQEGLLKWQSATDSVS